jgi:2-hydroxy-6-oxonona-2,4-dienedioate hydrolase
MRGDYVEIAGIKTFYAKEGSGEPVVLLHGASPGACTTVNWRPTIGPLAAAGFEVYAYDQPGFGYSDSPHDYSLEFGVAHAKACLDRFGLDRVRLVGNSMGGYIGARLAVEDARVRQLVLVASALVGPTLSPEAEAASRHHSAELSSYIPSLDNMRALTRGTLHKQALATEELIKERYERSDGERYGAQLERRKVPRPPRVNEELRSLHVPTLLIWGREDRGNPLERAYALLGMIPKAELHVFTHCGHWPQWDHADRFNKLVIDFFRGASLG